MTDELKERIARSHKSEMEDIEHYREMKKMADEEGCHEVAGIICDIIHDESTHAEALAHILNM